MNDSLYGGIELGGTKTVLAIGDGRGELSDHKIIPTTDPDETIGKIKEFFGNSPTVSAIGVGTFGPLNLDPDSREFGMIENTPKLKWKTVDLLGELQEKLGVDLKIELDVNCAALGELYFGNAKGLSDIVYMTIGTGVGGSLIIDKKIIHGILNLEMGHEHVPHEPFDNGFKGSCPYHGDCFEGIASGFAMKKRYGKNPEEIDNKAVWEKEARYIAMAVSNIMFSVGPEKIVLGGGIMKHGGLIEKVRLEVRKINGTYLHFPELLDYIVESSGELNGVRGAIKLVAQ